MPPDEAREKAIRDVQELEGALMLRGIFDEEDYTERIIFTFAALSGMGRPEFEYAGYGDIVVGLLALTAGTLFYRKKPGASFFAWLFNIAGMLDLANVSRILLAYYPSWYSGEATSAVAAQFPLVLILAIAAPLALLLHVYSMRRLLNESANVSPEFSLKEEGR